MRDAHAGPSATGFELRDIASGATTALLLRVAGGGCEFLLNLCIARMFGADGAGLFYVALTATTVGSVFARLGLDNTLLRLGAAHAAAADWGLVGSIARRGLLAAMLAAVFTTGVLYFSAAGVRELRPELDAAMAAMQLGALAVTPLALCVLYGELLKSIGRIFLSQLVAAVVVPLVALIAIVATGPHFGVASGIIGYALGAIAATALGYLCWRSAVPRVSAAPVIAWRELFRGTWSLLWIKSARLAIGWLATLALLAFTTQSEVGIYNVALRISLVLGLLLMSVNSVVAPRFAALFHQGEHELLHQTARRATGLVVAIAGPLMAVFLVAPGWIMSFFGSEFAAHGTQVLFVLAVGQCVNLLTGPVNYLLMMSGHEESLRRSMSFSVIFGALVILLLTPSLGALGAAIGTSIAMSLQSLAAAYQVWSKLGIVIIPLPRQCQPRGLV